MPGPPDWSSNSKGFPGVLCSLMEIAARAEYTDIHRSMLCRNISGRELVLEWDKEGLERNGREISIHGSL